MPSSAEPIDRPRRRLPSSRWVTPLLALGFGLVALAVEAARGDVAGGLGSLAVMVFYALVLAVFGGRYELVSLLRGDLGDERSGQLQTRALAVTGGVLVIVLVGGYLVELARGAADLGVWTGLCALAGLTFALSLAVLSRRS